jgi:hypothetical protein
MTNFVRGLNHLVRASFTRPNDTNAYTSGDVINNSTSSPLVLTFPRATIDAGGNSILQEVILTSSANQATKLDCELWLFDTTITPDNDNAVFTPTDAEMLTIVAVVAISASSWKGGDATVGAGGNALVVLPNLSIPINTRKSGGAAGATAGTNDLYGVLVARAAYTPVAQEIFQATLKFLD